MAAIQIQSHDMDTLTSSFYQQDTVTVAEKLLGKTLVYQGQKGVVSGIINETEAYTQDDEASHSYRGRKTKRNQPMFLSGGHIYMYLIYGMYYCFNIVTEEAGRGCAVLIRGIVPALGLDIMRQNRQKIDSEKNLANGPGKLVLAMQIPPSYNGQSILNNDTISITDNERSVTDIQRTGRIGITKGIEKKWRFCATILSPK